VHGKLVVDNGQIVSNKVDSMLATHRTIAKRMQRIAD